MRVNERSYLWLSSGKVVGRDEGETVCSVLHFQSLFAREVNEVLFRSAFTESLSLSLSLRISLTLFLAGASMINEIARASSPTRYTSILDCKTQFHRIKKKFCYRSPYRHLPTFCFGSALNFKFLELILER